LLELGHPDLARRAGACRLQDDAADVTRLQFDLQPHVAVLDARRPGVVGLPHRVQSCSAAL
jgi:hypothetical protein